MYIYITLKKKCAQHHSGGNIPHTLGGYCIFIYQPVLFCIHKYVCMYVNLCMYVCMYIYIYVYSTYISCFNIFYSFYVFVYKMYCVDYIQISLVVYT